MSSLRQLLALAILASSSNIPINAFLNSQPLRSRKISSRTASEVSSSNHKKAFRPCSSSLKVYEDDDEEGYEITNGGRNTQQTTTSFGADNVPVEQRPSNEYLNLISQPLFGWASQELGDQGLGVRLAITYIAFFVLV